MELRSTRDAYVGLDDATPAQWDRWHRAMCDERTSALARARFDPTLYDDADTAWSDATFRQVFLFVYDASFFDRDAGRYRTPELLERWKVLYGRVDSVLLWHAYPRLGFDARTQFDFYRDLPGGLAGLRAQVCDPLRAAGIRVFVDYNPWDAGSYGELADLVAALDADGVMLDTMTAVPPALAQAVNARRRGVVFAPERRPDDADLSHVRQSWAQWFDVGDDQTPTIYRHRWLVPRHGQLAIRRWDTSRRRDVVYSFFHGSGMLLWDDVFGAWNPYTREDRRLLAETGAVLDTYGDLFAHGELLPLVPSGARGLDANVWRGTGDDRRALVTLRNRTQRPLAYRLPSEARAGASYVAFWGDRHALEPGDPVTVAPGGVQAVVLDAPDAGRRALDHFQLLSRRSDVDLPAYEERRPPRRVASAATPEPVPVEPRVPAQGWVRLPGGPFEMTIRHARRECGCYAEGASTDATWGWFYEDVLTHRLIVTLRPFAIRATAVTNAEMVAWARATGYPPKDPEHFLRHVVRAPDGTLPSSLPADQAALPVTYVSLDDARAFASAFGQRLPTEAEWQWAAEGAGLGNRYPWGADARLASGVLGPADDPATATPQGVMGLSGNAWELTESEHDDGHTRFVLLRGGVFLAPGESEWLVAHGPHPNDHHAKYLLLADGLDRSATVSFRTVVDLL